MFIKKTEPPIILSVGGSLLVPNGGIDFNFLTQLNQFIRKHVAEGKRFLLITGGGKIMRHYRDAATSTVGGVTKEDLDWLGIHVTRVNAHLLRTIFTDIAHPRIIENYEHKLRRWTQPVAIGAGWKPGWSTDYDAVVLAKDYGGQIIINLSNIDWIYDKDPNKYKDARPIKKITWEEMEKIVGSKWVPGLNAPFDPIATQLAKKLNLTVIVVNGRDLKNLDKILDGQGFKGTVIMPFRIDASFYDREYYKGKKGGHRFSYAESFWGKIFHGAVNLYRSILIKILVNPKTLLDVGCGTGGLVKSLRRLGIEAYGVEISESALELADASVKPYLKIGDITNLPYPDNKFDFVATYDVLQHVERSKIKKAIEETIRVSKKLIFHKMYTKENSWFDLFHRRDFSVISLFPKKYWHKIFSSINSVSILRLRFVLPSFMETKFMLKKNK